MYVHYILCLSMWLYMACLAYFGQSSFSTLFNKTIMIDIKKVAKIASGDRQNYPLFPFETDREEDMESKLT